MCSLGLGTRAASSHPVDVGACTEAVILAELVRHGYTVLMPYGVNHRYDMVLDCGGRFVRLQCKTGRLRAGAILFATQSTRANTRRAFSRRYEGEVDFFMVFCPDTERVYAVPIEDVGSEGRLRVEAPANAQKKGIRWAAQYELPRLLSALGSDAVPNDVAD